MKLRYTTLALLAAICALSACNKKDSSANNVQPHTNNITQPPTPVLQQPLNTYPYTDTFAGTMTVSFYCPGDANYAGSDNNCRFFVTHVNSQLCMIRSEKSIQVEPYDVSINIADSVRLTGSPADSGDLILTYKDGYKNAIAFGIGGNSLSVTWDIPYMALVGACDWGESKAEYAGKLVKKQR